MDDNIIPIGIHFSKFVFKIEVPGNHIHSSFANEIAGTELFEHCSWLLCMMSQAIVTKAWNVLPWFIMLIAPEDVDCPETANKFRSA